MTERWKILAYVFNLKSVKLVEERNNKDYECRTMLVLLYTVVLTSLPHLVLNVFNKFEKFRLFCVWYSKIDLDDMKFANYVNVYKGSNRCNYNLLNIS